MRAAVYHGARDIRIEQVPDPEVGPDQVLLRVLRSGMCGTDGAEWAHGPRTFPVERTHPVTGHRGPMILGHEFVGEVVEGARDGSLAVGQVVASGAGVSCGRCDRCRQGRTNLCRRYYTLGLNTAGGMAELVAVPESVLRPVPDGLDVDRAGLAQPLAVGLHAARRCGAGADDRVVVLGAGAIGSFVLAGLLWLGVRDVTVVDFPGPRLERAARLGAAATVPAGPGAVDAVAEAIGPGGADVVVEATGADGLLAEAAAMVAAGGRILQVGLPGSAQALDVHTLVMREVTVETTLAHVCGQDLEPALRILHDGPLAGELLDSVRPLDDIGDQLDRMVAGDLDGKVLFDPASTARR